MVFDRTAISTGRSIQDFGLCDLKGVYQHTTKLRGKGFLVISFIDATSPGNLEIATALTDWLTVSPKIGAAIVGTGEREELEALSLKSEAKFAILWDPDAYIFPLWAVTAVPTTFIVNDKGFVLGRILGTNSSELSAAKTLLQEEVRKADEAAAAAAAAKAAADAAKK